MPINLDPTPDQPEQLFVNAAEIGRRLHYSAERIRQLHREGEMPAPVGLVGRSDIWRWKDIEKWARTSGRLT